ncbi:hypothetical protein Tco_1447782 [Tanacetum coccineum]
MRRLHTTSLITGNLHLDTFTSLGCTSLLKPEMMKNLDHDERKKGINAFWWDTPLSLRDIEFTTREPRLIVESIHIKFDEIKEMTETSIENNTSGLFTRTKGVDI